MGNRRTVTNVAVIAVAWAAVCGQVAVADTGAEPGPSTSTTDVPDDAGTTSSSTVPGTESGDEAPAETGPGDGAPSSTTDPPGAGASEEPDVPVVGAGDGDSPEGSESDGTSVGSAADVVADPNCAVKWHSVFPGRNASDHATRCVERRLTQLGHPVTGPDANLDQVSVASLRRYASDSGLPWRGAVGPLLLRSLGIWSGNPVGGTCHVRWHSVFPGRDRSDHATRCVERRLAQLGYPVQGIDTRLDRVSARSLRRHAAAVGVPWRGAAGPRLLRVMDVWSGNAVWGRCRVTHAVHPGRGSRSAETRCVERRLAQLGYPVTGIDRNLDPVSVASLRRYQRRLGLPVSGVAWPATLRRLRIWSGPPPAVLVGGDSVVAVGRRQVALTFDDGPSAYTVGVLDALARYGVQATFFPVGYAVAPRVPLLRRAVREGHSVQNHSWDHPSLPTLDSGSLYRQFDRTSDVVEAATGIRPTCYRPPYGSTSSRVRSVARSAGLYPEILWNVNPSDYLRPSPSTLVARSLASADGRGLIIGLHDGGGIRSSTVAALPGIISGLLARGYRFVTLCQ
jgi:peptidoglycan/xylan/chitin deacetylase (PgdA/CDA1 family)